MNTPSKLHRTLLALFITGISIFALAPARAQEVVQVTANNYVRAETDFQMKDYVDKYGCFGKFYHSRDAYDVHNQVTVRANRDTLYSFGVFDLRSPVTITLPETGGRYQSLMIVNQDHSIWSFYGPRTGILTEEKAGTRYVFLAMRTFMDPNDEQDLKDAHRLQDAVKIEQADVGKLEVPDWKKEEVEQMRATINVVGSTVTDSSKFFGRKEKLDPVYWLLGAALGWGGLPAEAATYANVVPEKNDGKTPYTLTVTDVPVHGFWSVTLYDDKGWMPVNKHNAYSFNNVTAKKDKDGSITIHFGGDPKADNFLPIVPGWNYIVRMYKPGPEILGGNITYNMKGSAMQKMIRRSVVLLWLVSANQVFSQQVETPYLHIPGTISEEAQALLRALPDPNLGPAFPNPDQIDKWKAAQQAAEARNLKMQKALVERLQPNVTKRDFGGVPVLDIKARGWEDNGKVLVYTHGGAYTFQSAASTLASSALVADRTGVRVISVDYTLAPHSKWRQTIAQVITVFKELKKEGYTMADIAIYGDSAGGGMAAGVVLKMRDDGIGMPAAVVLWSPWADITETGDTYETLKLAEPMYLYEKHLKHSADAYADPKDQKNPYVSPVYGDYTKGFPPTLIQGGTKEIFLSNFIRLYQALDSNGQIVKLDLYEGMSHVFQAFMPDTPESKMALGKVDAFLRHHMSE